MLGSDGHVDLTLPYSYLSHCSWFASMLPENLGDGSQFHYLSQDRDRMGGKKSTGAGRSGNDNNRSVFVTMLVILLSFFYFLLIFILL